MRKVILNLAVSLDGYIEGPNGEYDWCFTDEDYGMSDFFSTVDTIFMGRKSYELIAGLEEQSFPGMKIVVFSDTLTADLELSNVSLINSANFIDEVKAILSQPGDNIWLFGGATLLSSFLEHKLVSEFWLSIHPVVLGGGKPLFQAVQDRLNLMLTDTQTYPSGLVQLRYVPKPEFDYSLLQNDFTDSELKSSLGL
ncbi:dihydrofolate reductase [Mucilaginibacter robiniae]|uniref:Dihydrofolate reductase n=1 Tax=Mucilaginibacter robiniae TaxID=2728022 RepID=A0A7L5DZD9_9SPHI|nr:dihydrofolate reductase family protein [Mucilaginibacter robiniae]QJD96472.1 dihydrofolate reductase [Mucilaginibacter robiniae]